MAILDIFIKLVIHKKNYGYTLYIYVIYVYYCSVPGKRPWVLYHKSLFFTTLGTYLVYWVLTMCQIMYKISGWSQRIIAIVMMIQSRLPLASAPVSRFSQGSCSFVEHRSFNLLLYSHNSAACCRESRCMIKLTVSHALCSYIWLNMPGCKHPLAS